MVFLTATAWANELTQRSVGIGTSVPGANTTHRFQFNIASNASLGSIEFLYCENSPVETLPCTAPPGLDINSANIDSQTGETGFSIDPAGTTANRLVLSRAALAATPQTATYNFSNITNPTTANRSVYVRISTFASTDATGPVIDNGAVVFVVTSGGLGATGFVPPYLTFCVGISVQANCVTATGDKIDLGELSSSAAAAGTSQFAGATNDESGYSVAILGNSIASGNNVITAMSTPGANIPGTSQFGINLRSNSSPPVGADPQGSGSSAPTTNYDTPDIFTFVSGDIIVTSVLPTDFNIFTVSYIVNVPVGQAPGVYATTATFVATASF
jgi:hypothetical protein